MDRNQIEGNWKQLKGLVQEKWGRLTDDELTQMEGERNQLLGRIQELYGITLEEAEKELEKLEGNFR
ncbi:MAG: CsbD family protein [Magnetospiraceae bacterium]